MPQADMEVACASGTIDNCLGGPGRLHGFLRMGAFKHYTLNRTARKMHLHTNSLHS